jgi:aminopeptidase N
VSRPFSALGIRHLIYFGTMRPSLLFVAFLLLLNSCSSPEPLPSLTKEVFIKPEVELPPYNPSPRRGVDVFHTELSVSLDWAKEEVNGTARISLGAFRQVLDTVVLDAKFMEIASVKSAGTGLNFTTDSHRLYIPLKRALVFGDTLILDIQYTARPSLASDQKQAAIGDNKGFYFINADGSIANVKRQAWTQGQTESNSVWFPTIDKPNEKMTFDLSVEVDADLTTLSNGELEFQEALPNGRRKDFWSLKKPHAPYLCALAVGLFVKVEDTSSALPIAYYVEEEWANEAKRIFGKTPKMIETYGKLLNYPYPWPKYDQIVVRDYVSGAMENTGCVIHGDFLYQDGRQRIDGDNEDIIAHELFHHWFGDLLTCESWSNLTLNEGFASYGEYLWHEAEYGKADADAYLEDFLESYLDEADHRTHPLIAYRYEDRDMVFDHHSYDKGALVLHYLRWVLGDETFFGGLNFYLNRHAFQSVEVHDFRIAMEDYSGRDLNWFFDQFFLQEGHPILVYTHTFEGDQLLLNIEQTQEKGPKVYEMPLSLEIAYSNGKKERRKFWVRQAKESLSFPMQAEVSYVQLDPAGVVPGLVQESKTYAEYKALYENSTGFRARMIGSIGMIYEAPYEGVPAEEAISLLEESDPKLLASIVYHIDSAFAATFKLKDKLLSMTAKGVSPQVRVNSIETLMTFYRDQLDAEDIRMSAYDPSLMVTETALSALLELNFDTALEVASKKAGSKYIEESAPVALIYSLDGTPDHEEFFLNELPKWRHDERYELMTYYVEFLLNGEKPEVQLRGAPILLKYFDQAEQWWYKVVAVEGLKGMRDMYAEQLMLYETAESQGKADGIEQLEEKEALYKKMAESIDGYIQQARATEKDKRILMLLR